ncbi:hypothetical protein F2P81_009322 [Scophthalmus maximus]|uniref:Uncharacterized protein n=1 Tax=Scophthalmus maximus TaxID=52904 RepID=A0A6A4T3C9_SCOMX|nr:hypothetical protein F2P81_009322 [Scophthalmus maximus]
MNSGVQAVYGFDKITRVLLYTFVTAKHCCVDETYPSPLSGSVAAALPASPSDAMFQINENKKQKDIARETGSGGDKSFRSRFRSAATPQVHT